MKTNIIIIFLCTCGVQFLSLISCENPKIAIIGAGIGGTSCATFLRELFGDKIDIDIYEKHKVGGRLHSFKHQHKIYETGGFTISSQDQYTEKFVKEFNLKSREIMIKSLANCDKNELNSMSFEGMITKFYNFPTPSVLIFLNKCRKEFTRIYKLQKSKKTFKTLNELLNKIMKSHRRDNLRQCIELYSGDYEDISSSEVYLQINYGQHLRSPPLIGYFAFDKLGCGAYTVDGGNCQLAEECLKKSKAQIHFENVIEILKTDDLKMKILSTTKDDVFERIYDHVIIASPLAENYANIKFVNFPNLKPINGKFSRRVVSIIQGNLKMEFPRVKETDGVVFLDDANLNYILRQGFVNREEIWKLQSSRKVPDERMKQLFGENHIVLKESVWLAYPNYKYYDQSDRCDFILDKNLYYINCIEWAASSIEMSIIGAKNVALLLHKNIGKQPRFFPFCTIMNTV